MEELKRLIKQHERRTKEDWIDAQQLSTELKELFDDRLMKCIKIMEGLEDQRVYSMKLSHKSNIQHTLSIINIIRADVFDFKKIAQLPTRNEKAQYYFNDNPPKIKPTQQKLF